LGNMDVWDAPPLPARAAGRVKPVFVGRAAEIAAVEQSWAAVNSGARELIFVGGEPGAGKSRFVEKIAAALHRSGALVLIGTCSPEPGPPYEPFVECLEQLLSGTVEGALADCLPDSLRATYGFRT
jgi:predicted ATPase